MSHLSDEQQHLARCIYADALVADCAVVQFSRPLYVVKISMQMALLSLGRTGDMDVLPS